jgi:uncharacterized protein (TIGR00251 family)
VVSPVRQDGADLLLEVRVQPRASQTEFAGLMGDRLRVRLQAPPVDGKANASLVEFVADAFGVPRSAVVLEKGLTGRDKRLRVRGVKAMPAALQPFLGGR